MSYLYIICYTLLFTIPLFLKICLAYCLYMCPQTFLRVQKSPSFSVFLPPDHSFLSVLLSHLFRDLYKAFQSLGRGIFIICSKQEMIKNRALEKKRKSERVVEERWRGRREPNKRKGRKIVFSGLFPGEHPGSKPRTCSFQQQLNCPWELCHVCLISCPGMRSSAGSLHQSMFFFCLCLFSTRAANYHHRKRANIVINH